MNGFRKVLILAGWLIAAIQGRAAEHPDWNSLERLGIRIRSIHVDVVDVFDLNTPGENTWFGRGVDALHGTTRPGVIRGHLTFREGEPLVASRVLESERRLRSLPYLKEADIRPEPGPEGEVDLRVRVRDAWSLLALVGATRSGGQTRWGGTVFDTNIMGTGKTFAYTRTADPERTSHALRYEDPQVLGGPWTFNAGYAIRSDGRSRSLALGRPFRSLETPWSTAALVAEEDGRTSFYDRGQELGSFRTFTRNVDVGFEWRAGLDGDKVSRLGIWARGREQQLSQGSGVFPGAGDLPASRRTQGLLVRWSLAEDRYVVRQDFMAVGRKEDLLAGWNATIGLGWYPQALGSTRDAVGVEAAFSRGFDLGDGAYAQWQGAFTGRREGRARCAVDAWSTLTGYRRLQPWQVLAGRLTIQGFQDPDLPRALYFGGDEGFRGYRNHLYAGDRRWLATVEDRFLTDLQVLGLVKLGFAVYADVGAVRRITSGAWTPALGSLGAGLRLADLKSSFSQVYNITVALPLKRDPLNDPFQILMTGSIGF